MSSFESKVERGGVEIPVSVSFVARGAEPDVGIMGAYPDDVEVSTLDGKPFEVTPPELEALTEEAGERLGDYDGPEGDE